jgi:hypothetical protein
MKQMGQPRIALGQQVLMCQEIEDIIYAVKAVESTDAKNQLLREKLSQMDFPPTFRLPLDSNLSFSGVEINKSMVIRSKKPNEIFQAVMLQFENADPHDRRSTYKVMYKVGEDIRQNQLTLKILTVMNSILTQIQRRLKVRKRTYSRMNLAFILQFG